MSHESEFYPATLSLEVEYADKTREFVCMNTTKPITKICNTAFVPHCTAPTVTVGAMKHYRKQVTMVADAKTIFEEHGAHPPLKKRAGKLRYENSPPEAGSVIGFVNFRPFYYAGKASPSELAPNLRADVFLLDNTTPFVTINTALQVLYEGGEGGGPLTSYAKEYFRQLLCGDEYSFTVKHRPNDPYDMLLLVKLLNIVPKKTTEVTCVATETVDRYLALSGYGIDLDWECARV